MSVAGSKAVITVPANSAVEISAVCNAGFTQYVRILDLDSGLDALFIGSGETQSMLYKQRNGEKSDLWELAPADHDRQFSLVFTFQTGPGIEPQPAKRVQEPIWKRGRFADTCVVQSEDAEDNDLNDTQAYIVCIKGAGGISSDAAVPRSAPAEMSTAMASGSNDQLFFHGKIGYTPPLSSGGMDEFNAGVYWSQIPSGAPGHLPVESVSALSWKVKDFTVEEDRTQPIRNYLYVNIVLEKCDHDGMNGAELVLSTYKTWILSRPTGYSTDYWTFVQHGGGTRRVTKVRD